MYDVTNGFIDLRVVSINTVVIGWKEKKLKVNLSLLVQYCQDNFNAGFFRGNE